jgi:hypothetical protein
MEKAEVERRFKALEAQVLVTLAGLEQDHAEALRLMRVGQQRMQEARALVAEIGEMERQWKRRLFELREAKTQYDGRL